MITFIAAVAATMAFFAWLVMQDLKKGPKDNDDDDFDGFAF